MVAGLANPEAVTRVISEEFYDRVYNDIADRRIKSKKKSIQLANSDGVKLYSAEDLESRALIIVVLVRLVYSVFLISNPGSTAIVPKHQLLLSPIMHPMTP